MTWWGWLIIVAVASAATGLVVWLAMRHRSSDAAADAAQEVIDERRRIERGQEADMRDAMHHDNPFRVPPDSDT